MGEADDEVRGHVVRVVEAGEEGEVRDVREESERTERRPKDVRARAGRVRSRRGEPVSFGGVEMEEADGGVVEAVEDGEGGGEVVELFSEGEVCQSERRGGGKVRGRIQHMSRGGRKWGRPRVWKTEDQTHAFMLASENVR